MWGDVSGCGVGDGIGLWGMGSGTLVQGKSFFDSGYVPLNEFVDGYHMYTRLWYGHGIMLYIIPVVNQSWIAIKSRGVDGWRLVRWI